MSAAPGKLYVKVMAGRDLKDGIGRMEPFVAVTLGKQVWRTTSKRNQGSCPIWEEDTAFDVDIATGTVLVVTIVDGATNKVIGVREMDFAPLLKAEQHGRLVEGWYPMRRKGNKKKFAGDVLIRTWFQPMGGRQPRRPGGLIDLDVDLPRTPQTGRGTPILDEDGYVVGVRAPSEPQSPASRPGTPSGLSSPKPLKSALKKRLGDSVSSTQSPPASPLPEMDDDALMRASTDSPATVKSSATLAQGSMSPAQGIRGPPPGARVRPLDGTPQPGPVVPPALMDVTEEQHAQEDHHVAHAVTSPRSPSAAAAATAVNLMVRATPVREYVQSRPVMMAPKRVVKEQPHAGAAQQPPAAAAGALAVVVTGNPLLEDGIIEESVEVIPHRDIVNNRAHARGGPTPEGFGAQEDDENTTGTSTSSLAMSEPLRSSLRHHAAKAAPSVVEPRQVTFAIPAGRPDDETAGKPSIASMARKSIASSGSFVPPFDGARTVGCESYFRTFMAAWCCAEWPPRSPSEATSLDDELALPTKSEVVFETQI